MATDWEAVAWHSEDPARMRAVMEAFAPHCADSLLPRTLGRRLRRAGFSLDRVSAYPILNLGWSDGDYSCQAIPFIVAYIKGKRTLPDDVLEAWAAEQRELAARGEYYFMSNRMFFEVTKPA